MVTFEQALKNILKNARVLPIEKAAIEDSVGRILQEDICSGLEMPPFDKSAMDGYAVCSLDTQDAYAGLKCIGIIQAGESFTDRLKRGECVKIMTGAPLPKGADSVVMVENTRVVSERVKILRPARKGENVCFKGEDIRPGQRVFKKGREISSADVGILAAVGRSFVKVVAQPKAAILNTGGEIVSLGNKLGKNKIYNSNGPMLCALLKSDNINPQFLGIAKDNIIDLKKAVKKGLNADILLISGGVSMGDYDLIPKVLKSSGVKKVFHKVNIKPGKPLFFGVKDKTPVFGIPGNPVSNFLSYFLFVRPAIQKMMGYENCKPRLKDGIIEKKFHSKAGRKHFVLVRIFKKANQYYLTPVFSHGSADTLSLSRADGFMIVDENSGVIKKNSPVQFIPFHQGFRGREFSII